MRGGRVGGTSPNDHQIVVASREVRTSRPTRSELRCSGIWGGGGGGGGKAKRRTKGRMVLVTLPANEQRPEIESVLWAFSANNLFEDVHLTAIIVLRSCPNLRSYAFAFVRRGGANFTLAPFISQTHTRLCGGGGIRSNYAFTLALEIPSCTWTQRGAGREEWISPSSSPHRFSGKLGELVRRDLWTTASFWYDFQLLQYFS